MVTDKYFIAGVVKNRRREVSSSFKNTISRKGVKVGHGEEKFKRFYNGAGRVKHSSK